MQRDDWTSIRGVALVGLGVLLGVVALYVPSLISETDPEVAVRPGDTEVSSELNRRMVLLEESIRELNQSIALLVESPALAYRVEPTDASAQGAELAPADGAPTTDRIPIRALPDPEKLDWAEHIHPSLARVLVEYGLTPYGRGVDRILPEAARQMREATSEWLRLLTELNERRYPNLERNHPLNLEYYQHARSEIDGSLNAGKKEVVASFREQVQKLALK